MNIRHAVVAAIYVALLGCGRTAKGDVEEGNRLFQAGKYVDASLAYRKAIQKEPAMAEAHYRLGLNILRQGESREGYNALLRAASLDPARTDIKVTLADVSLELHLKQPSPRLHTELTKLAAEILASDPNSFDGLRLKGTQAMMDRQTAEAIKYLRKANQIKPLQPNVALVLAQALFQEKEPQEAERLSLDLISKEKSFVAAYDLLFAQYRSQKRFEDAENILKRKVQNNPTDSGAILQLAQYYAAAGKSTEMQAVLKPLSDNRQAFPNGLIETAQFYKSIGKTEEAMRKFEEGVEVDSKNATVYRKGIVNTLLDQKKGQAALAAVDALVREDPKDLEALALRATMWVDGEEGSKLDTAIADLTELQKQKPKDGNIRFTLGRAYWRKGNYAAAITEFREAARERETAVQARAALAEIGIVEKRYTETVRLTEEILRREPQNPRVRILHAAGIAGMGDTAGAKREVQKVLQDLPAYRDAHLQLAFIAIQEKDYRRSEDIFRRLYQTSTTGDVRPALGLATVWSAQNQQERAIQFLDGEVKKSPASGMLRTTLAAAAAQGGKPDMAIEQYMYLSNADPTSANYLIELGTLYDRKGDVQKAIKTFEGACEKAPKDPRPFALLANALRRANRAADARAAYQRAVNNAPGNALLLNNMAFLVVESGGDLESALKMAQRAVRAAPSEPLFADTLGWIYLKQNKVDSAFQIFDSLVRKNPENPSFRYHLGMALLQKGEKAGARRELEAALTKKPSSIEESEIRQALGRL